MSATGSQTPSPATIPTQQLTAQINQAGPNNTPPTARQTAPGATVRPQAGPAVLASRPPPSQRYIPNAPPFRQNGQKRSQPTPIPSKRVAIAPPGPATTSPAPQVIMSALDSMLAESGIAHSQNISAAEAAALSSTANIEDEFLDLDEALLDPAVELNNDPISTNLLQCELPEPYMEDFAPGMSHYLSEEDLLRRRKKQVAALYKFYKLQFRRLEDDLVTKHRRFLIQRAKHLQKLEKGSRPLNKKHLTKYNVYDNYHDNHLIKSQIMKREASTRLAVLKQERGRACAVVKCPGKAMPATKFCYAHILQDKNQKLFQACEWVTDTGEACGFPVSVHNHPSVCYRHIDLVSNKRSSTGF